LGFGAASSPSFAPSAGASPSLAPSAAGAPSAGLAGSAAASFGGSFGGSSFVAEKLERKVEAASPPKGPAAEMKSLSEKVD